MPVQLPRKQYGCICRASGDFRRSRTEGSVVLRVDTSSCLGCEAKGSRGLWRMWPEFAGFPNPGLMERPTDRLTDACALRLTEPSKICRLLGGNVEVSYQTSRVCLAWLADSPHAITPAACRCTMARLGKVGASASNTWKPERGSRGIGLG